MIDEDGNLSEAEILGIRKNIAHDNLKVFGIKLSPSFFKKGELTDEAVAMLESLAPTISMQKILSSNVIGIGFLTSSIKNLTRKMPEITVKGKK